jgi:hypothetical protein
LSQNSCLGDACIFGNECSWFELGRFEKRVTLRKFDKYVTEVQMHADEVHGEEKMEKM